MYSFKEYNSEILEHEVYLKGIEFKHIIKVNIFLI